MNFITTKFLRFSLFSVGLILGACSSTNWVITGQVDMVHADKFGDLTSASAKQGQTLISEGDVFSIRLDSVFTRELKEVGGAELLIYAEIYDVQPDDRKKLVKIMLNEEHQSEGYTISQKHRLLFGPIKYNGHPIRVRLFIIELDKEDNAKSSAILNNLVGTIKNFNPTFQTASNSVLSLGDLFVTLNEDDREFVYDFTLYPKNMSKGPYLRTGSYALIKTENPRRTGTDADCTAENCDSDDPVFAQGDHGFVTNEHGQPIKSDVEDYVGLYSYSHDKADPHPLGNEAVCDKKLVRHNVLRIMDDGLVWLQTVAIEFNNEILLATPNFGATEVDWNKDNTYEVDDNGCLFKKRTYKIGGIERKEVIAYKKGKEDNPVSMRLDKRFPYREKTHAVISVVRGGKQHPRSLFEQLSSEDQKQLTEVLQPELTAGLINEKLKNLKNSLVKVAQTNKVVDDVNIIIGNDTETRNSAQFPLAYLSRLQTVESISDTSTAELRDKYEEARLANQGIIETVRSFVIGFKWSSDDGGNSEAIEQMKKLTSADFVSLGDGQFCQVGGFAICRQDMEIVLPEMPLNVRDTKPYQLKVTELKDSVSSEIKADKLFFQIKGSTTPASDGTPSKTDKGGSLGDDGNYIVPNKVPEKPPVIRVFAREAPAEKWVEFTVPLRGYVQFKDTISITDTKITANKKEDIRHSENKTLEEAWLKRGGTYLLTTELEKTAEPALTTDAQKIIWEIIADKPESIGKIDGNKFITEPEGDAVDVTLRASSEVDPTVSVKMTIKLKEK